MSQLWLRVTALSLSVCGLACSAQKNSPAFAKAATEEVAFEVALEKSLQHSSLTYSGKPFHAVLAIGTPQTQYSGQIEAWWINDHQYRIEIGSPAFRETKTVSDTQTQVKTEGDYFPRWLENFTQALIDPVPMAANFRGRTATSLVTNSEILTTQVSRDDRTEGITDPMTEGQVIFAGPDYLLRSTSMFNNSMLFADWQSFGDKKIARTYETELLDHQKLSAKLMVLEELRHPDLSMFNIDETAPAGQGIPTMLIPTAQAETLLLNAPVMNWPAVREGRTDGYMIVFARTDRSGQVRETAEFSSHNPNDVLQKYGMEQALKYKFKPLVVDGVAVQFETPLVLHFISKIDNPIPILNADEMKRQMLSCNPTGLPKGPLPVMHCRIAVDQKGAYWGFVSSDPMKPGDGALWGTALNSLKKCTFKPYLVNGQPTFFKGDIELVAR